MKWISYSNDYYTLSLTGLFFLAMALMPMRSTVSVPIPFTLAVTPFTAIFITSFRVRHIGTGRRRFAFTVFTNKLAFWTPIKLVYTESFIIAHITPFTIFSVVARFWVVDTGAFSEAIRTQTISTHRITFTPCTPILFTSKWVIETGAFGLSN